QRTAKKNVIPGRDRQHWDLNIRIMFFDGPSLPVVVIAGMGQPIEEVWSQWVGRLFVRHCLWQVEQRVLVQRKSPHSCKCVRMFLDRSIERVLSQAGSPGLVEPL